MIQSVKDYPFLWLLTVVLLFIAIFVFALAKKNKLKAGDSPESVLTTNDLLELRKGFTVLTEKKIENLHSKELIFAIVTNIEIKLDNETEFENLSKEQKRIYALWHFCQAISGNEMCDFFKEFGEPLTSELVQGIIAIDEPELASIITDAFNSFDESNEAASCDKATQQLLNESFKNQFDRLEYYSQCEKYIRDNFDNFKDE